jgi:hypothetical protein
MGVHRAGALAFPRKFRRTLVKHSDDAVARGCAALRFHRMSLRVCSARASVRRRAGAVLRMHVGISGDRGQLGSRRNVVLCEGNVVLGGGAAVLESGNMVLVGRNLVPPSDTWFSGMKNRFSARETWFSAVETWFSRVKTWFSECETRFSLECTRISQVAPNVCGAQKKRDRMARHC